MRKTDLQELREWVGEWIKIPDHCDECAKPKAADMAVYTFLNNFEKKRFPTVCRCKPKAPFHMCKHGTLFISPR